MATDEDAMSGTLELTTSRTAPAGAPAKGEFRCTLCGYGVAVHRELPRCPMCAGEDWEPARWSPFTRELHATPR